MVRLSRSTAPWKRRDAADKSYVGKTMCCVRCRRVERGRSHVAQKESQRGDRRRFRTARVLKGSA